MADEIGEESTDDITRKFLEENTEPERKTVQVEVEYEADGTRIVNVEGEEVVIPSMEYSIEWVLDNPVPVHTFDEPPLVLETDHPEGFDVNIDSEAGPHSADYDIPDPGSPAALKQH